MTDGEPAPEVQEARPKSTFFGVDREVWHRVCELGVNDAAAYLVMAAGTGGDQQTTRWSVNAIEQRTGIGRRRAKKIVCRLVAEGIICIEQAGSKPKYRLLRPHEIPGCPNYVEDKDLRWFADVRSRSKGLTGMIWLPVEFVGLIADENTVSPLERVRTIQDIDALRVLVDLYAEQTFDSDGGIPWRQGGIRQPYRRSKVGTFGDRTVWAFTPGRIKLDDGPLKDRYGASLTKIVALLVKRGLADFVPHLVEDGNLDAEILHAVADWDVAEVEADDPGVSFEGAVASRMEQLVRHLASEQQLDEAKRAGATVFAPMLNERARVQVVGILRLRFRPETTMRSVWRARWKSRWLDYAIMYRRAVENEPAFENVQHQGSHQGWDQGSDQGPVQGGVGGEVVPYEDAEFDALAMA